MTSEDITDASDVGKAVLIAASASAARAAIGAGTSDAEQGVAVADATDANDIVAQFNALLASLRTAGVIAS